MASLHHEHLVTVFQVAQEGGAVYLAMELLRGETLEDWLAGGRRAELAEILRLGREMAAGLAVIHRAGLIHRDIKPANIWREAPHGRVKILDFGLARPLTGDAQLTKAGQVLGTPAFMSPEQARGKPLDVRSDLFSLGAVLYCLCTGERPFAADTTLELLTALVTDDPRPVQEVNPALPPALGALVMRLLAKDPADRPAAAEDVLAELERIARRTAAPAPATTAVLPPPGPTPAWSRGRLKAVIAVALLFGVSTAVGVALFPGLAVRSSPAPVANGGQPLADDAGEPQPAPAPPEKAYLSTWTPLETVNWIKQPPPPRGAKAGKKPPPFFGVRVGGTPSPHGIFMHPPQSEHGGSTALSYRLGKGYQTFAAEVSLNDGPYQSSTPLTFSVHGDGRLLWRSRPVWSQSDTQDCAVPVDGVEVLRIEVDCPGSSKGAHAVWLEPHVTR
jgi:serine/threonine protein kinase